MVHGPKQKKVPVNDDVQLSCHKLCQTASSSAIPSDWKTYNDGKYLKISN